ncbi:MAG: FMN-binding negative transcriptional regulator [Candidatus Protistobacter heckmanni]|nr:FMN-binding negative transcriptional regulator [Candidatus Protistobacter heckmanni]
MYIPRHFATTQPDELQRIIQSHPLGVLVTHGADGLDANHRPFEFDPAAGEASVLTAQVARANPVWRKCADGDAVMVVFRSLEGYVSPNWYPSKHEAHRQVPTWNYEVVHAHGRITIRDDEKFVRGVVARLTRRHEADEPQPWKMGDSAPEYIDMMLKSIVGIEVAVTRLEGKSKLSQSCELRDRKGVVDALRSRWDEALAQAVEKEIGKSGG